ncbi:uridine phosphorylase [Salinisphaera sp.]|uniref:uridine phosphorylase n=1 Tax=Salinisphaera sp. TaxID=1914330 RepID=UPI002D791C28|nr:uridine phosphorylase [Salinisphaera sp.]HET7314913.1 uridine phosphorylase [Salinisphaera sp.]
MSQAAGRQYHIGLGEADIEGARYALLPGDPGRVPQLARGVGARAVELGQHREHCSWLAYIAEQPVLVCSTGLGAPSTAVAVEELANIGVTHFIRVGTSGSIQPHIDYSDLVISKAAVRLEGTSSHYAPLAYPAVASFELTASLVASARALDIPHHVGITASSDTFWPGQERYDNHSGYVLRRFQGSMAEWRQLKVTNFEMEAAALFTVCATFGLSAACVCGVIAKRVESEEVRPEAYGLAEQRWNAVLAKTLGERLSRKPEK